jgi:hypothetical protein
VEVVGSLEKIEGIAAVASGWSGIVVVAVAVAVAVVVVVVVVEEENLHDKLVEELLQI